MPALVSDSPVGFRTHSVTQSQGDAISEFVIAFESARADGPADLMHFLPPPNDPRRPCVLVELICIDLEVGWESGQPTPLALYKERFPEAFHDHAGRQQIAFEDYRQRIRAGQDPVAAEYAQRFDVSIEEWPSPKEIRIGPDDANPGTAAVDIPDSMGLAAAARSYQEFRQQPDADLGDFKARSGADDATRLFGDLHQRNPEAALRLAQAATSMPASGSEFAGFRLVRELGRGAFGRVFLAEQKDLGDRQVVLKVSMDVRTEVQALSQLLHTNIVPIYSVHRCGVYQAVCMPFCGSVTLSNAIRRFRGETLPDSGRGLVTLLGSAYPTRRSLTSQSADTEQPRPVGSTVILDQLEHYSYVDAVLWIGSRLADALAHAHERGILHRDLKPANVLLTDEGQPLLLDFNLSTDTKLDGLAEAARLGGTLPYMPPEHLESFGGKSRVIDGRGDIYALGVILYELLTARLPFRIYGRASREIIERMIKDRQMAPSVRKLNPAVSPSVEAIVHKCLAFDPADRYANARALMEDLDRHLGDEPLKHAPNRSIRERLTKWCRRHPRLSSWASIGTCAAVLIAGSIGFAAHQRDRRMGLEARENWSAFRDDSMRSQLSLTGFPGDDNKPLAEAVATGRKALEHYPSPNDPNWDRDRSIRHLSQQDREALREEVGTILLLLANATDRSSGDPAATEEALRLNQQAESCFPPGSAPRPLLSQRTELLERLNRPDEARVLRNRAGTQPETARALYLEGWELARQGKFTEAVPLLERATCKDPQALWAWFLLGRCYDRLQRDAEAVSCYSTCLALRPDAHQAWFNRAIAQLRRAHFKEALADFDRAIELRPEIADAYFNRGLARKELGDLVGAEADLTAALERGSDLTRVYFVRADVRDLRHNGAGAASDRREGLQREPVEESCWNARGYFKLGSDPKGALADFDKALERNPRYLPAFLNKSHVFGEILKQPADAVIALDTAIKYHPQDPQLWAGRAVYLARLGKRAEAHHDAEEALHLSNDPAIRYQVAGAYALTSKEHPEDRPEAFRLLASALKRDYGFDLLGDDPELDAVRDLPEFTELVRVARALKAASPK
jgi:eukaryotic-like serine/threonine-protein kinase